MGAGHDDHGTTETPKNVCPDGTHEHYEMSWGMRYFSLALFVFASVYFLVTVIWWRVRRNRPELASRSFWLMFLNMCGFYLQFTLGPLTNYITNANFPCDLFIWLTFLVLPLIAGPITTRILLFYNRGQYRLLLLDPKNRNEFIADEAPTTCAAMRIWCMFSFCRNQQVDHPDDASTTSSSRFRRLAAHISTTPLYCVFVMFCFGILSGLFLLIRVLTDDIHMSPYGHGCKGCHLVDKDYYLIFGLCIVVLIFDVYLIARVLRSVNDPFGIKKELWIVCATVLLIAVSGVLVLADPQHWQAQGLVDYTLIVSVTFLIMHTIQCTIPVWSTYAKAKPIDSASKCDGEDPAGDSLESIFTNAYGNHAFEEYLASEFSLENKLFYDQVEKYKSRYDNASTEANERLARDIKNAFLNDSSMLQVNISWNSRTSLDETRKDMFDLAQKEVYNIMLSDSLPRFRESIFYSNWVDPTTRCTSLRL
mmetsp:Transcript_7637/g.12357  ORF Transcript_7637/g.12357 Transcript_7637/m.12357 type:complete len:478 (+) Transcript_7637:273-1706(+)